MSPLLIVKTAAREGFGNFRNERLFSMRLQILRSRITVAGQQYKSQLRAGSKRSCRCWHLLALWSMSKLKQVASTNGGRERKGLPRISQGIAYNNQFTSPFGRTPNLGVVQPHMLLRRVVRRGFLEGF